MLTDSARRDNQQSGGVFLAAVAAAVVIAVGLYAGFLAAMPACGPSRNSLLGQIYWLVPLTLGLGQALVIGRAGRQTGRSRTATALVMVLSSTLVVAGGIVIFLHFYGAGHCGE